MEALYAPSLYASVNAIVAAAKGGSGGGSNIVEQVALSAVSAFFGFACSYALGRIGARRDPRKEISWEAVLDRGVLAVGPEIRENVNIHYKGENVKDLAALTFRITNTGNRVVKNEEVRFAFSSGSRILDAYFEPTPEPELRAAFVDSSSEAALERKISIGHLEATQEVTARLIVAGQGDPEYKVHGFNEEGDVKFQRRDASRINQEQDHVVPFIVTLIFLIVLPPILESFFGLTVLSEFSNVLTNVIRLILFIFIAPHILPVARLVRRITTRWLVSPEPATSVTVQGENAQVVAASGQVENLSFAGRDRPGGAR